MIGSSGSNGESVPNETMKPVFLFEVIQTVVVPFLMQKNWLFFALGMPGFTLEELPALVMSTVQGADAEPQVLAAVHRLAGLRFVAHILALFLRLRYGTGQQHDANHGRQRARLLFLIFIFHLVGNG